MKAVRPQDISPLFEPGVSIVPERLRRARELRSLTQDALADQVKLDQSYIAMIEKGDRIPSEEAIRKMASALTLPISYFFQPIRMVIDADSIRYRASSKLGKKITATLKSESEHYLEILAVLTERVNPMSVKLKSKYESPKTAARRLRAVLGIEQMKPFTHLIRNFESLGGIVIALGKYEKFDAFADWIGKNKDQPVAAMTSGVDSARLRMTIAHEIGHLVLHKDRALDPQAEHEAFEYGSELLMPEIVVKKIFSVKCPSLADLSELRSKWGISEDAIIYSANRLGLLTDRQYRSYNIRLRADRKPVEFESSEQPRALTKMAEVAYGVPLPYDKMTESLHIGADELQEFFERYAPERSPNPGVRKANVLKMSTRVN